MLRLLDRPSIGRLRHLFFIQFSDPALNPDGGGKSSVIPAGARAVFGMIVITGSQTSVDIGVKCVKVRSSAAVSQNMLERVVPLSNAATWGSLGQ